MAKSDRRLAAETAVNTQLPDFIRAVEKMKAEGGRRRRAYASRRICR